MFSDLLHPGIPLGEKLLRTLVVYTFLLVGLRLAGKRELGQLNPFDLVVLLLLSNTLQNAIIGDDNSLLGGVIGATALLALNWLVVRYLYDHPMLERVLVGRSDLLVRNGRVLDKHLRRELITREDLEAAARRQGLESLSHVETCRLEVGGALTFIAKAPNDEERRHRELIMRLGELGARQEALLERVASLEQRSVR